MHGAAHPRVIKRLLLLLIQVPWMTLWLNAVADMPGVCFALRAVTGSTMRAVVDAVGQDR